MTDHSPTGNQLKTRLSDRIDRAAGGINAVLVVLAIGLATLDLTCFCAFEARDVLPAVARISAAPPNGSQIGRPAAQAAAVRTPSASGTSAGNR